MKETKTYIKDSILRKAYNYWLIDNEEMPLPSSPYVYKKLFEWWVFNLLNSRN